MTKKNKSILDGIPIIETDYPLDKDTLVVAGNCPSCGAPVYGKPAIKVGEEATPAVYSCGCWRRSGVVDNKLEHRTK